MIHEVEDALFLLYSQRVTNTRKRVRRHISDELKMIEETFPSAVIAVPTFNRPSSPGVFAARSDEVG